jgi:hypothetical protein
MSGMSSRKASKSGVQAKKRKQNLVEITDIVDEPSAGELIERKRVQWKLRALLDEMWKIKIVRLNNAVETSKQEILNGKQKFRREVLEDEKKKEQEADESEKSEDGENEYNLKDQRRNIQMQQLKDSRRAAKREVKTAMLEHKVMLKMRVVEDKQMQRNEKKKKSKDNN